MWEESAFLASFLEYVYRAHPQIATIFAILKIFCVMLKTEEVKKAVCQFTCHSVTRVEAINCSCVFSLGSVQSNRVH